MQVIDDTGRLFGLVNVVDAAVVLLVFALLAGGIAVVMPADDSGNATDPAGDPATRYATLNLGTHEPAIASLVDEGDTVPRQQGALTVEDVHYAPGAKGKVITYARVKIPGRVVESGNGTRVFQFGGEPLRVGKSVNLVTSEYKLTGTVLERSRSGTELDVQTSTVLLESTARPETVDSITAGDAYRLAGQRVGSVETVRRYPSVGSENERLHVGLALTTIAVGGERRFGDTPLRTGERLEFDGRTYRINGTILERDRVEPRGEPTTLEATVELRDVDPAVARSVSVGATERVGERLSIVKDVTVEPATVVIQSDDGQVYGRGHPTLEDVTITVDLAARQSEHRRYFHGRPVQINRTIVFDLGTITVEGRITELEQ